MSTKKEKIYQFDILLFLLIMLGELSKTYIISTLGNLTMLNNFIQIPLYLGLFFLIIEKKYSRKQVELFAALGLLLFIGYIKSEQAAYFRGLLLILGAKDVPFKRIARVCRNAMSSTFLFTVALWILGISDSGLSNKGKAAFGYGHPNITAQTIMIILFLWLAEKEEVRGKDYAAFEIMALVIILFTGSKTVALIMVLTPVVIGVCKWNLNKKGKSIKFINFLMESSQFAVLLFTWWAVKMLPNLPFLKALDLIVTNRLFLNYYLFNKYDLKWFGQNVSLHESAGVYNNIQDEWNAIITCDNTYALSLLIMGIIPTAIFLLGYILIIRKAIVEREHAVIVIAFLMAFYAFCESQMVEIYYNFAYLYILALPATHRRERMKIAVYDT